MTEVTEKEEKIGSREKKSKQNFFNFEKGMEKHSVPFFIFFGIFFSESV